MANTLFTTTKPIIAAKIDEIKIASFAAFIISASLKAKRLINIDIVKPIPPKILTEKICLRLIFFPNVEMPVVMASQTNKVMPIGLPKIKPSETPSAIGEAKSLNISGVKVMSVLLNANIGRMKKLTGICMP